MVDIKKEEESVNEDPYVTSFREIWYPIKNCYRSDAMTPLTKAAFYGVILSYYYNSLISEEQKDKLEKVLRITTEEINKINLVNWL